MSCQLIGQTPTVAALLLRSVPSWDPFHWPKASTFPRLTRAFFYYCCALAWIASEGFAWRKAQWAAHSDRDDGMVQRLAARRIEPHSQAACGQHFYRGHHEQDASEAERLRAGYLANGPPLGQVPTIAGSNSPIFLENYNEYCRPVIL